MNFLKKLFKGKESIYKAADDLIIELTAAGMVHIFHNREKETSLNRGKAKEKYKDIFFNLLNEFRGLRVNQRHLTMMADLSTSDINTNEALTSFLEKNDYVIDVFGEIADVSAATVGNGKEFPYIVIYDTDKTKKVPRITTINIHVTSDEFKKELQNFKKGDRKAFKIKLSENTSFMDASGMMQSHIDSHLNFHYVNNYVVRIASNAKIRYDIKGEIVGLNGKEGTKLINH